MTQASSLIFENSLQVFFFDLLIDANKKSMKPLPNEIIFYSSLVMDKFGSSHSYFEEVDGKIREKILGIKLLESYQLPKDKQKNAVKDVGETALLVCGYFSDSLNKKIIDTKYYNEIGILAYSRLNSFIPKAYDIPNFFDKMSKHFHQVTALISLISEKQINDATDFFLIISDKKAV
ncbi:MAG: hypothetical protein H7281_04585 [Bacteriovorax sp.]|nr:hypothetical protein [Bacteriovorax sp.]